MINKFPVGHIYASRPTTTSDGRRRGSKSIRYLDLSFEGKQQQSKSAPVNNGFLPHGGHRVGKTFQIQSPGGIRSHPPSPYSFNKSEEYHQGLQDDLDELLAEEGRTTSPTWAIQASRETTHSGESPLFVNKLIASNSRVDREGIVYPKALMMNGRLRNPPPSADSSRNYRPNSMHQFLAQTELRDASQSEANTRLGRPTRTTLLRARQRCNSAPVNAYDARRELQRKAEENLAIRGAWNSSVSVRDVIGVSVPDGESLHSFLTGARYNRAHYLDSKSLVEHGVYMPRGNPLGCFVVKPKATVEEDEEYQGEPPDSPVSDLCSVISEESFLDVPSSPHPSPSSSPRLQTSVVEQDQEPDEEATIEVPAVMQHTHIIHRPMSTHITAPEVLLNVKGVGLNRPRPFSAFNPSDSKLKAGRPQTARVLPSVLIKGSAIHPSPRRESLDMGASTPSLSIHPVLPVHQNVQPIKVDPKPATTVQDETPPVTKVDKSVNVPSISGDNPPCDPVREFDEHPAPNPTPRDLEEEADVTAQAAEAEHMEQLEKMGNSPPPVVDLQPAVTLTVLQPVPTPPVEVQTTSQRVSSPSAGKSRKGKVRFADQVEEGTPIERKEENDVSITPIEPKQGKRITVAYTDNQQKTAPVKDDSVQFFLTEDEGETAVVGGDPALGMTPDTAGESADDLNNQTDAQSSPPDTNQNAGDVITVDISVKSPD